MWQPASERLQHFQTMLKTKLNVLTLRKEPLPTVIFHEPEAIELCSATPHTKSRTHAGYKEKEWHTLMIMKEKGKDGARCTSLALYGKHPEVLMELLLFDLSVHKAKKSGIAKREA
ncbi:hypothetical protein CRENBAI_005709 [Crenichthys baileyi]|uniref:Uncharacterized protein n=1 Tax=Crenichthys baileyi TaxID=28760 RepID=A0AAV9RGJ6_9TELE